MDNVVIKKPGAGSGTFTYDYLAKVGKYKFMRANGRSIAIQHNGELDNLDARWVTILEDNKLPLWMQSMHLQMGRTPRNVTSSKTYRVEQLKESQLNRYRFEIYKLCSY